MTTARELRDAVRRHCQRMWPPAPEGHYEALILDLRREPRETWDWWLDYFAGQTP